MGSKPEDRWRPPVGGSGIGDCVAARFMSAGKGKAEAKSSGVLPRLPAVEGSEWPAVEGATAAAVSGALSMGVSAGILWSTSTTSFVFS